MIAPNTPVPVSEEELEAFIRAFEECRVPKSEWTHAAHVLAGAAYTYELGEAAAIVTMRERVKTFNLSVGGENTDTSGYHETLTIFWIKIFAYALSQLDEPSRLTFAVQAVRWFGHRSRLHESFYDFDVVGSREARREWVAPSRSIEDCLSV